LRARQAELAAKIEQRKKPKLVGSAGGPAGRSNLAATVGSRSERLNAAQKERMKLLTTAAFDHGKAEDTFGAREEDWQLYKKMGRDNEDDDEPDENELELARINARLQVFLWMIFCNLSN
jgi:actin-related protein 5